MSKYMQDEEPELGHGVTRAHVSTPIMPLTPTQLNVPTEGHAQNGSDNFSSDSSKVTKNTRK